jgi:hypothetical protein
MMVFDGAVNKATSSTASEYGKRKKARMDAKAIGKLGKRGAFL